MKKKLPSVVLLLLSALAGQAHAQVFRCKDALGKITYSDSRCEANAQVVNTSKLQSNTIDASDMRQQAMKNRQQYQEQVARNTSHRVAKSCPSDQEIHNMEVSLTSITLRDKKDERAFLQAEIRRAKACSSENNNYTKEDWDISKRSQAAQNNLSSRDRQAARTAAESMHSSVASDDEKARMMAEKNAEAQQRQTLEAMKRSEAMRVRTTQAEVTNCDAGGCWSSDGTRYTKGAGNFYSSSKGGSCQVIGSQMQCN